MSAKQFGWVRRFMRWLFGAPFEDLPSGFGNLVPAELRLFEAEAEVIRHHPHGRVSRSYTYSEPTKPPR